MKRFFAVMTTFAMTTPAVAHGADPMAHLHPHGTGIAILGAIVLLVLYAHRVRQGRADQRTVGRTWPAPGRARRAAIGPMAATYRKSVPGAACSE